MRPANASTRKVWIAGASGFCGQALTTLLSRSNVVYPHIRPRSSRLTSSRERWEEQGIEPVITEWDEVSRHLDRLQPDVIISVIGTTKKRMKREGESYKTVDVGLNLMLIDWATQQDIPPHFVYLSSMGINLAPLSRYMQARVEVEDALSSSGLRYSVIRPGILAGESRDEVRFGEALGAALNRGLASLFQALKLQRLSDQVRPLDAPEVAAFIQLLIETPHRGSGGSVYALPQIIQSLRSGMLGL